MCQQMYSSRNLSFGFG
uniref:Uncharacterized protein n=1 Tax=Anguilla anguilla TaxID=7936 RepID=A0A0E9P511_ANGAN